MINDKDLPEILAALDAETSEQETVFGCTVKEAAQAAAASIRREYQLPMNKAVLDELEANTKSHMQDVAEGKVNPPLPYKWFAAISGEAALSLISTVRKQMAERDKLVELLMAWYEANANGHVTVPDPHYSIVTTTAAAIGAQQ